MSRWRIFEDVPLPRWHDDTPLLALAARKLACDLPGVRVMMYDPDEDPAFVPDDHLQPLGSVSGATAAGDHVLATIHLDTHAMGGERIARMLDAGELRFGLWGTAEMDPETNVIVAMRPTSVRITNTRPLR